MAVQYKGFTIGHVKSIKLADDGRVEVTFNVFDIYNDYVKEGSLVEVKESPIGFGSQFNFYPGKGNDLKPGDFVPMRNSPEGREMVARGLAIIPAQVDLIADLLAMANTMVDDIMKTLEGVNLALEGLNTPTDHVSPTALGQTLVNVQTITSNLADDLANPSGIRRVINGDGDSINALEASLVSVSGILDNLERSTHSLPREMPHIYSLISNTRGAVHAAENVLVAVQNNPLLRRGVPAQAEVDSSGTNPRNVRFLVSQ
jgi:phospholipid/cholesterol/gamma-HCH transport system substrate-binding protein